MKRSYVFGDVTPRKGQNCDVWGMVAMGAASVIGGAMSADAQGDATQAQVDAQMAGIEEQRRQFDKIVELNQPFHQASVEAVNAQKDLLGLGGGGGGGSTGGDGEPTDMTPPVGGTRAGPGQYITPRGNQLRNATQGTTGPELFRYMHRYRGGQGRTADTMGRALSGMDDETRRRFVQSRLPEPDMNSRGANRLRGPGG